MAIGCKFRLPVSDAAEICEADRANVATGVSGPEQLEGPSALQFSPRVLDFFRRRLSPCELSEHREDHNELTLGVWRNFGKIKYGAVLLLHALTLRCVPNCSGRASASSNTANRMPPSTRTTGWRRRWTSGCWNSWPDWIHQSVRPGFGGGADQWRSRRPSSSNLPITDGEPVATLSPERGHPTWPPSSQSSPGATAPSRPAGSHPQS